MPAGEAGLCPPADVAACDFIGGPAIFFTLHGSGVGEGQSVPLAPYLQGAAFDPQAIAP